MPVIATESTIAISYQPQLVSIPVDNHWVTAITLINIDHDTPPVDCWALIGLKDETGSWQTRFSTLAAGYCGSSCDVYWSGKIIADPATAIFAELLGEATRRYRLVAVVNKIIATEGNRIVVDP